MSWNHRVVRKNARRIEIACVAALLSSACGGNKPPPAASTPESPAAPSSNATTAAAPAAAPAKSSGSEVLTGEAATGDYRTDAPGVRRKLTAADLAQPNATRSVRNQPRIVPAPEGALPKVPEGFRVNHFATGLDRPRMLRKAPNGDLFVSESKANRVRVLRDADGDGKAERNDVYASGLSQPFGIAFYPPGDAPTHVYVANTGSVVRFAYAAGDTKASGKPETIISAISGGGQLEGGGHWTRDLVFSKDGTKLYVSVGSRSNVDDDASEERRARIFEYTPDGKNERVFAYGIRNPVGLAIHPESGEVWASVNERDELGDHLVPDYITHVKDGGFYGWPWYYIGGNQDPRHAGKRPELKDKVIVPDVLLQSHSASLGMTFYTGDTFPEAYRGRAFAAEHGSWNRARRTGYKVITVPMNGSRATGEYEDFMTGFVESDDEVWGRPVAVEFGDGALYVSDDGGGVVWRVTYAGT